MNKAQLESESEGTEGTKRQRPAEMAVAEVKPAPAQKHLEADGGSACSLLDLPVELLVEIFASLPGTELPSLAQVCTKFHRILHSDSIWTRRCREEYGLCENLQDRIGMSYRKLYAQMFPYRNILGLWQLGSSYKDLLNVVVDGSGITGWWYEPYLNNHADDQMQWEPEFRIRLRKRKSATLEYKNGPSEFLDLGSIQTPKDSLSILCNERCRQKYLGRPRRGRRRFVLSQEDRLRCFYCQTYRRIYLPPSHPDDLIRPGLFQGKCDAHYVTISVLHFHGKYARVTEIMGMLIQTLEIHLMRRIPLREGGFFHDFNQLSRVGQEIHEQVLREQQQQQQQQQQEDGTEESEGRGWMCFYGVNNVTAYGSTWRYPGVFILFDENHFGFICPYKNYFFLYSRVQNTFQNVEAPSPLAFLEMFSNCES
ncbi:F-box only protein 31-like [Myotis yumanensis]|uniref:F-box only protein 31-like n=1 Tax=Myotis yumanensis TaxID=159337 RepID=UPI0038D4D183